MVRRYCRSGYELDRGVVEHLGFAVCNLHFREPVRKAGRLVRVGVVHPLELGAGLDKAVAHPVDVPVVQPDSGKDELALFTGGRWPALWGIVHTVSRSHRQTSS